MKSKPQSYLLDKVLSRIDFYIDTTNSKASFLIAFNTFILGSIIFGYDTLFKSYNILSAFPFSILLHFSAIVIIGGCTASILFTLRSIQPFLKSGNTTEEYHSLLYFGSIKELKPGVYKEKVENLTQDTLDDDLIRQTHVLSTGLKNKFDNIGKSIICIKIIIIPVVFLSCLKIIDLIIKP